MFLRCLFQTSTANMLFNMAATCMRKRCKTNMQGKSKQWNCYQWPAPHNGHLPTMATFLFPLVLTFYSCNTIL